MTPPTRCLSCTLAALLLPAVAAAQSPPIRPDASGNCKTDYGARSSSAWIGHSVCSQPEMTIDGQAVFTGPEGYNVNTSTTVKRRGETQTSQRTVQRRWLGADCGDLKPLDLQETR